MTHNFQHLLLQITLLLNCTELLLLLQLDHLSIRLLHLVNHDIHLRYLSNHIPHLESIYPYYKNYTQRYGSLAKRHLNILYPYQKLQNTQYDSRRHSWLQLSPQFQSYNFGHHTQLVFQLFFGDQSTRGFHHYLNLHQ